MWSVTPLQRTTPSPPPSEHPTVGTAWLGAPLEESDPDVTAVSLDTALAIVTLVVKCPSQEAGASLVVA